MKFQSLLLTILLTAAGFVPPSVHAQVLDKKSKLESESFWDNRDFEWYSNNIPFFECSDRDITTTYYYRWIC